MQEELTYTYGILKPGACMFRAMPLERAHAFAEQLRQKAEIPLFIATNLEKGGNGILTEGTLYASPMEIEATANEQRAVQLAQVCAQGAACVGANWSFAPIIDIDRNFRNPITNTRTFGSDSEMVRKLGSAYVRTIQSQGFAATIKHFPGDGCDERDQHLVTSINDLSCEEWDNTYGATYKACIDDGALCCMVAWLSLPQMILYTALYLLSQWLMPHITPQMLADWTLRLAAVCCCLLWA